MRTYKVYTVGDAGMDRFVNGESPGAHAYEDLPSGSNFVNLVLNQVLSESATQGAKLSISSLVERAEGHEPHFEALPSQSYVLVENISADRGNQNNSIRIKRRGVTSAKDANPSQIQYKINTPAAIGEQDSQEIIIAHQAGSEWPQGKDVALVNDLVDKLCKKPKASASPNYIPWPRVLVNLSSHLPTPRITGKKVTGEKEDGPFRSAIWNALYRHKEHVGIVTCMSALRDAGAIIGRRLSFEHTIEDLGAEIYRCPQLSLLAHFSHLFVRIGMVGVVHVRHLFDDLAHRRFEGELYFAPYAKDGLHRNEEEEGFTVGRDTLLIAALLSGHAWVPPEYSSADRLLLPSFNKSYISRSCNRALQAMRKMDDYGYEVRDSNTGAEIIQKAVSRVSSFFKDWNVADPQGDAAGFGWRRIPTRILEPPSPRAVRPSEPWYILDDVLADAPVHRINVALAIVMVGYHAVFNQKWERPTCGASTKNDIWNWLTRVEYWNPHDRAPDFVTLQDGYLPAMPQRFKDDDSSIEPVVISDGIEKKFWIDVPVVTFGKLNLVERKEVESLRAIANLFRSYQDRVKSRTKDPTKNKAITPWSIAIFGAPGTGKSYMVKQIAEAVAQQPKLEVVEYNVAQFTDVDDLNRALKDVISRYQKKTSGHQNDVVPLVFFDEFDCVKGNVELGWLKYFLAPMQDGIAADGSQLPPAIFVFAGGLHSSFGEFDPCTDPAYDNLRNLDEYKRRLQQFIERKGPDFISRLRGHVNVLPINDKAGRPKHFIRRAMVLRGLLEAGTLISEARAKIDPAIVYALLTIDVYRHGLRSMQAIVEMCTRIHDEIKIASLPSHAQLDMHVNATEFMVRVHRGRARTLPEWQSENFGPAARTLSGAMDRGASS